VTINTLESVNRFDLEQDILNCWHVTDDIDTLLTGYLDGPEMSQDDVANVLLGLKTLPKVSLSRAFLVHTQRYLYSRRVLIGRVIWIDLPAG
jgi:hypothetical protein